MKFENVKQVISICNQIEKHQNNLDAINGDVNVSIVKNSCGSDKVFTIGTMPDSEHEYSSQARGLIDTIKSDLQKRIDNLKSRLESL